MKFRSSAFTAREDVEIPVQARYCTQPGSGASVINRLSVCDREKGQIDEPDSDHPLARALSVSTSKLRDWSTTIRHKAAIHIRVPEHGLDVRSRL